MEREYIVYEWIEGVAKITLNRPDVLNCVNRPMAVELQSALDEADSDESVRAILLTGAGRAFCAGQDLEEAVPKDGSEPPSIKEIVRVSYNPIIRRIRKIERPFICAVNGVAAGAGANIALACDFVIASSEASFIQAFCKIGLIPDSGGTYFLPRLVGLARATAMSMLGAKISPQLALQYGMIFDVVPPEKLQEKAFALAKHLSTQPTVGLALIKRALNASLHNDLESQLELEEKLQGKAGLTQDYLEGVKAFQEKRPPNFVGQ